MKYVIKSDNKTYYKGLTGIGPCFGATKDKAMLFDRKWDAETEMLSHSFAFFGCTIEKLTNNKK